LGMNISRVSPRFQNATESDHPLQVVCPGHVR
jgi:hypothetical protein